MTDQEYRSPYYHETSSDLHSRAAEWLKRLRTELAQMTLQLPTGEMHVDMMFERMFGDVSAAIEDHREYTRLVRMAEEAEMQVDLKPIDLEHLGLLHPADGHEHGPGTHTHEGWEPSRVVERLKRDGFCGHDEPGGYCMRRDEHTHA